MNVDTILNYEDDPKEDYYGLLGCDSSATNEQIVAEFKARAKDCHPDKNTSDPQSQEKFQLLLRAKEALTDPQERSLYDAWRSANIAVTFAQWRSLKDTVKSSMHWATPKTSGRMLTEPQEDEVKFSDEYEPTPYKSVGFRIATPPPSIWSDTENPSPKPSQSPPKTTDSGTAMRRRQFAVRRQSTIGAMVMAEKWEDNEIRRRFRNYEI